MEKHLNKLKQLTEDYFDLIDHLRLQKLVNDGLEAELAQYNDSIAFYGDSIEVDLSVQQESNFLQLSEELRNAKSDLKFEEGKNLERLELLARQQLSYLGKTKVELDTQRGWASIYIDSADTLHILKTHNR